MRQTVKTRIRDIVGTQKYFKMQAVYHDMTMKKNRDLYEKLQRNVRFKDAHKGQRCFILGNGPSLRTVDLQRLNGEIIFTVNLFNKIDNFDKVDMKYHFWIDGALFEMRDDVHLAPEEIRETYRKMGEKNAVCFIPSSGYDYVKKKKLDKCLDLNYLDIGNFVESMEGIDINLCRLVPAWTTVVQYAIYVAIYMGFGEIYLLGCDTTNIIGLLDSMLGKFGYVCHVYDNDETQYADRELLENWKMNDLIYDQYILFRGYDILGNYCNKQGIKLINCSSSTLINEIPRESLDEILKSF